MSSPVSRSSLALIRFFSAGVAVDHRGERGAEALLVGAALDRVDRVGEGVDRLGVGRVPLHRDLGGDPVALRLEADHRLVDRVLGGVEVLDEVGDAALVAPLLVRRRVGALVAQRDGQALVEEGHLLQPAGQRHVVEVDGLEDVRVGPEGDRGAVLAGGGAALDRAGRLAVGVGLRPHVAVEVDLDLEPARQRVDHRHADAVQAAGHGVGLAVELAAGVQRGQHDLDGRPLLDRVLVDRDAAAVVDHPHAAVGEHGDLDPVAEAGQRLVDGVVDHLGEELVQPTLAGRSDIHTGALADGLESLEDGDGTGVVVVGLCLGSHVTTLSRTGGGRWVRRTALGRSQVARRDDALRAARAVTAPHSIGTTGLSAVLHPADVGGAARTAVGDGPPCGAPRPLRA